MAGTKLGALNAKKTNLERHGDDFFKRIGSIGGSARVSTKGFGANPERARLAGIKGGSRSRRGKASETLAPRQSTRLWYFTFGFGQVHEGCYTTIRGSEDEARAEMFRRYGNKWANQYSASEWFNAKGEPQAKEYNLREIN